MDHKERVFGIDIENVALLHLGPAEQAGIIEPYNRDSLGCSALQLDQCATHKERYRIAHSIHAANRIQQVVGHWNGACDGVLMWLPDLPPKIPNSCCKHTRSTSLAFKKS